jgi:hypothetical protein
MTNSKEKTTGLRYGHIPIYAYVLAFVIAVIVGFILTGFFKAYQSEMTLMVIARSEKTAIQKKDMVENLSLLPQMLSFYDLMLKNNRDIVDLNTRERADKRKEAWNRILEVSKMEKNNRSLIHVYITLPSQNDSEEIVKKTTQTLMGVSGRYYDIRNDVDLRVVDGPITKPVTQGWFWIIMLSLSAGAVVIMVFSYLPTIGFAFPELKKEIGNFAALHNIRDILKKKEDQDSEDGKKEIESIYTAQEGLDANILVDFSAIKEADAAKYAITDLAKEESVIPQAPDNLPVGPADSFIFEHPAQYPNFPELPVSQTKVASAPANLPFADEGDLPIFESPAEEKIPEENLETASSLVDKEPTKEELKARLNQLLKGEL